MTPFNLVVYYAGTEKVNCTFFFITDCCDIFISVRTDVFTVYSYQDVTTWMKFHVNQQTLRPHLARWNKDFYRMKSHTKITDLTGCEEFIITVLCCQCQFSLDAGALGHQLSHNEAKDARLCRTSLFQLLKHVQCILHDPLCLRTIQVIQYDNVTEEYKNKRHWHF